MVFQNSSTTWFLALKAISELIEIKSRFGIGVKKLAFKELLY